MSKLAMILQGQLKEARQNAGRTILRTLGRGLHIEIRYVSNSVYLTLRRQGNYPSMAEWDTVLKHFPFILVVGILPVLEQKGNEFMLRARFPIKQDEFPTADLKS